MQRWMKNVQRKQWLVWPLFFCLCQRAKQSIKMYRKASMKVGDGVCVIYWGWEPFIDFKLRQCYRTVDTAPTTTSCWTWLLKVRVVHYFLCMYSGQTVAPDVLRLHSFLPFISPFIYLLQWIRGALSTWMLRWLYSHIVTIQPYTKHTSTMLEVHKICQFVSHLVFFKPESNRFAFVT